MFGETTDKVNLKNFLPKKNGKRPTICIEIMVAGDSQNFFATIAKWLRKFEDELPTYWTNNKSIVEKMGNKFFNSFNVEGKGQSMS